MKSPARWLVSSVVWLTACPLERLVAIDVDEDPPPSETSNGDGDPSGRDVDASSLSPATTEPTTTGDETRGTADGPTTSGLPPLDDSGPRPACEAPAGHTVCDDSLDVFHTIGLNCPSEGDDHTPIQAPVLASLDDRAWVSASTYGNGTFAAREGTRLLVMTNGWLPELDAEGRIDVPFGQTRLTDNQGDNGNPDNQTLPLPIRTISGSNREPFLDCDGHGDCSETLPDTFDRANDLMFIGFDVVVPNGTFGYQVDLAWFSSEFPLRVGAPDNDLFVWWQSSDAFTGNVATFDGAPMSATGLQPYISDPSTDAATGNVAALQDTGFEGSVSGQCEYPWGTFPDCPNGASTGWMTLEAPVQPGETIRIVFALFDQGDADLDTTVLIDNFRWSCGGCEPGSTCGLRRP